jgi:hypothetical protein
MSVSAFYRVNNLGKKRVGVNDIKDMQRNYASYVFLRFVAEKNVLIVSRSSSHKRTSSILCPSQQNVNLNRLSFLTKTRQVTEDYKRTKLNQTASSK